MDYRDGTYEEDAGDVEGKGDAGVEEQHGEADLVKVLDVELAELAEPGDEEVHDGADGGVVVETDEGVHLLGVLVAFQQDLDHDETDGLEDDAAHLEDEADPGELDLAKGGEADAADDEEDVVKGLHGGVGDAPDPAGEEDGDGGGGLEHLDEGDGEVEVDEVGTDEGARVEDADGHDGAQVDAARHLDLVAAIEEGGEARQHLGCQGGEDEVPEGEDHGWSMLVGSSEGWLVRRTVFCGRLVTVNVMDWEVLTEAGCVKQPLVEEDGQVGEEDPASVKVLVRPGEAEDGDTHAMKKAG